MRDFFSLDGPFNKYGTVLADILILSLMWLFFSLPLFTVGAATSALFYVTTRRIANREGYVTQDFWIAFKANFRKATVIWIMLVLLAFLLVFNLLNIGAVGNLRVIIFPVQIIILVQTVFMTVYIFPMLSRFDMDIKQVLKSSFFMANRHLPTSLTCVVLLFGVFISIWFMPIMFFVAPGLYGLLSSYMVMRVFKKYRPEMDRDPVLEIQEIEAKKADERRLQDIKAAQAALEDVPDDNLGNEDGVNEGR